MTTTAAFLAAWAVIPTSGEFRNVGAVLSGATIASNFTNTADADFEEGRGLTCTATATGAPTWEPVHFDSVTLVDGDELYAMFTFKVTSWTTLSGDEIFTFINERVHNQTAPFFQVKLHTNSGGDALKLRGYGNDGSNVFDTGQLTAISTGTKYTLMVSLKRNSSTNGTITVRSWDGTNWNVVGSAITGTWTAWTFAGCYAGVPFVSSKTQVGVNRYSRVIVSINVIPKGSMLCDNAVLAQTPDGSTYDEWANQTGTDSYAMVDDAFGSESSADYMESSSTTSQKTEELNFTDVSGISDTIRGVVLSVGVASAPSTINGTAQLGTRLSSTDSLSDAYYNDSNWNVSGSYAEPYDTARFFEKDPSGTAWTQTNVNSATYLFRKLATGSAMNWRINSAVLQVLHGDTWTAPAGGTIRSFGIII